MSRKHPNKNRIKQLIKRVGRKVDCPVCHNEPRYTKNCMTCNYTGKVRLVK